MSPSRSRDAALRSLDPVSLQSQGPIALLRDGDEFIVARNCEEIVQVDGPAGFSALRSIQQRGGFWAGAIAYDFARSIEHIPSIAHDDRQFSDLVFGRFATVERFSVGQLVDAISSDIWANLRPSVDLGALRSSLDRTEYAERIRDIHDHLVVGDCYQINLTRRLNTPVRADPLHLFAKLAAIQPAPHCALVKLEDVDLVSASPELLVRLDGRSIQTRPIKGTAVRHADLRGSQKDHAEHVMIVDLARNDLGRVCEYGSVTVPSLQTIEHHPGLVHLVSTVTGSARPSTTIADIIRATFPAASITGAPKPKVMQLIETLEPVRRGFYCGSIGWIDCDREVMDLSVAIRTFTMSRHGTDFAVGGGIVWDSNAPSEWDETVLKASHILRSVDAYEREPQFAETR